MSDICSESSGDSSTKGSKQSNDAASHEEHLRLAGIVKGVHADLRKKFKNSGGFI